MWAYAGNGHLCPFPIPSPAPRLTHLLAFFVGWWAEEELWLHDEIELTCMYAATTECDRSAVPELEDGDEQEEGQEDKGHLTALAGREGVREQM